MCVCNTLFMLEEEQRQKRAREELQRAYRGITADSLGNEVAALGPDYAP